VITIDITALNKGIYFLKLTGNKETITKKVIKE
jgi:hypothetical protein